MKRTQLVLEIEEWSDYVPAICDTGRSVKRDRVRITIWKIPIRVPHVRYYDQIDHPADRPDVSRQRYTYYRDSAIRWAIKEAMGG